MCGFMSGCAVLVEKSGGISVDSVDQCGMQMERGWALAGRGCKPQRLGRSYAACDQPLDRNVRQYIVH